MYLHNVRIELVATRSWFVSVHVCSMQALRDDSDMSIAIVVDDLPDMWQPAAHMQVVKANAFKHYKAAALSNLGSGSSIAQQGHEEVKRLCGYLHGLYQDMQYYGQMSRNVAAVLVQKGVPNACMVHDMSPLMCASPWVLSHGLPRPLHPLPKDVKDMCATFFLRLCVVASSDALLCSFVPSSARLLAQLLLNRLQSVLQHAGILHKELQLQNVLVTKCMMSSCLWTIVIHLLVALGLCTCQACLRLQMSLWNDLQPQVHLLRFRCRQAMVIYPLHRSKLWGIKPTVCLTSHAIPAPLLPSLKQSTLRATQQGQEMAGPGSPAGQCWSCRCLASVLRLQHGVVWLLLSIMNIKPQGQLERQARLDVSAQEALLQWRPWHKSAVQPHRLCPNAKSKCRAACSPALLQPTVLLLMML